MTSVYYDQCLFITSVSIFLVEPKADSSRAGVRTRRTDTNILSVKFNSLAEAGNLHTGDAEICSNDGCGAIVSHLTKLDGNEDDIKKVINPRTRQSCILYMCVCLSIYLHVYLYFYNQ